MLVASFTLRRLKGTVEIRGETASGLESIGQGSLHDVANSNVIRIVVRDTMWANGERDIVACGRHDSPERFTTLIERLRLTVLDRGGPYVELRQARLRPNGRAGLFDADLAELNDGAGLDVAATLLAFGATEVSTRAELLGDEGRTRRRIGVRFPEQSGHVPLVAYVLTRVCPVAANVSA
jgi:hypothetical protein